MFRQDYLLSGNVRVQGEVSNCRNHRTGLYFTLKDDKAVINCVMFHGAAAGLDFSMKPGDSVIVTGSIDTYLKSGGYQLYAKKIEKAGAGALYEEFLKLKQKLSDLGMFDAEYKQPIPPYASRIGIVTAPTGAVIRDIANVSRRRHPGVQLVLYPSLVQGENAAEEIVRGIETLDEMGLDVLIVGRGGGSMEDLWAFNEEAVAHAIFNTKTPVISAVGHETDWTIADFVADLRAPTPSAAAELAVPDIREILENLHRRELYFNSLMNHEIDLAKRRNAEYSAKLEAKSPENILRIHKEKLSSQKLLFDNLMNRYLERDKHRLGLLAGRLDGSSPMKKLSQGYSFVSDAEGKGIRSVRSVSIGDELNIHVKDGMVIGQATSIFAE